MQAGPTATASEPDRRWVWSVVLVASLLAATWPGIWLLTDQAYAFVAARRLVEAGTFVLTDPGQTRSEDVPWLLPGPHGEIRTQIYPLVPVLLAPLAALDSAFGLWGRQVAGGFVNAFNPLMIVLALVAAGRCIARETRRLDATVFAVLSIGVLWPTHHVARYGMAEPLLVLLATLYACAQRGERRRMRCVVLALLPWSHPTGVVVGAVLASVPFLERRRGAAREMLVYVASTAAFMAAWNYGFHGHWIKGGYASLEPPGGAFGVVDPWRGLWNQVAGVLTMSPLPVAASLVALLQSTDRRALIKSLAPGYLSLAGLLALFCTHYFGGEPSRHLAPVWPMVGLAVARSWPTRVWAQRAMWSLVIVQALLSLVLFVEYDGRYYEGPGRLFYPAVLWVKLAIERRWFWASVGLVPVVLAFVSLVATLRALYAARPEGDETRPTTV